MCIKFYQDTIGRIKLGNKSVQLVFGYEINHIINTKIDLLMPKIFSRNHDAYMTGYLDFGK